MYVRALLAVIAIVVAASAAARPAEAVLNGALVAREEQQQRGLVVLVLEIPGRDPAREPFCSGALLSNDWVLTAGHCANLVRKRLDVLSVELADDKARGDAIYLFGATAGEGGPDLALIHLNRPLAVNGSRSGFQNELWPGGAQSLMAPERTVTFYGRGMSVLGSTPAEQEACQGSTTGEYRTARLRITDTGLEATRVEGPAGGSARKPFVMSKPLGGGHYLEIERNAGQQGPAPGDSGGAAFLWQDGKPYIVGVLSGGNCVSGRAYMTSIPTVRDWVSAVLQTPWSSTATSPSIWVRPAEVSGTSWGLRDVNQAAWAQAARGAAVMCGNRGLGGGHYDGHQGVFQGNSGFGIQCGNASTLRREVSAEETAATGWGFTDVRTVPWTQANRAAHSLCERYGQGSIGGHFSGQVRQGRFELFCYKDGAQWFDATDAEIAAAGFPAGDLQHMAWAQAARAATGVCRARGFSGGFFNGYQDAGKRGVICQK